MDVLLGTLVGVLLLAAFYRAVRLNWPEQYFAAADSSVYSICASPVTYSLFRTVPVYLVCLLVAVSLDRQGSEYATGAALAIGLLHGGGSLGAALMGWIRTKDSERRHLNAITLVRLVALVAVLAVAALAAITRDIAAPIVPAVSELLTAGWVAALSGVAVALLLQFAQSTDSLDALLQRSYRSLPGELRSLAIELAKSKGADPDLVLAVMTIENLQRPAWFRFIESHTHWLRRSGTYGIMQVTSPKRLSDEESVREAIEQRISGARVSEDGYANPDLLRVFALKYNGSEAFGTLLLSAWYVVRAEREAEARRVQSLTAAESTR